jgi:glycine C-acetyltransferase
MLRQRSRPYLFSNSVAPSNVAAALKALEICARSTEIRDRLGANTRFFRAALTKGRFNIVPGEHPIIPIMIGDAALAGRMAERLLEKGVYAIGFSYPVVPQGKARVRVQISAAHTREDLEFAIDAFTSVRDELGL